MEKDDWLNAVIAKGLMGLVALRLPNTPPEEIIVKTAQIWVLALTKGLGTKWEKKRDTPRIEKAFMRLYAECDRFPNPKMLIERLPRDYPETLMIERKITEEDRKRASEMCQKLREILTGVKINA